MQGWGDLTRISVSSSLHENLKFVESMLKQATETLHALVAKTKLLHNTPGSGQGIRLME